MASFGGDSWTMRLPSCTNMTCTPTCDDKKQAAARLFPPLFLHAFIEWHQLKQPHSKHLMARWITQLGSAHAQQERGRSTLAGKKRKKDGQPPPTSKRARTRERKGAGSHAEVGVPLRSSLLRAWRRTVTLPHSERQTRLRKARWDPQHNHQGCGRVPQPTVELHRSG